MIFSRLLALAAFSGLCSAHFSLVYPPTRGFNHDIEATPPCGGYNNVTTRTPFPLGSANVVLSNGHATNFLILISFANNPSDIANWTSQAPLVEWVRTAEKDACFPINIGAGNYSAAAEGVNATILVQGGGGSSSLFQCADVVLSASATLPSNITCTNPVQATGTGSGTEDEHHASATATTTTAPNSAQALTTNTFGTILLTVLGVSYSIL